MSEVWTRNRVYLRMRAFWSGTYRSEVLRVSDQVLVCILTYIYWKSSARRAFSGHFRWWGERVLKPKHSECKCTLVLNDLLALNWFYIKMPVIVFVIRMLHNSRFIPPHKHIKSYFCNTLLNNFVLPSSQHYCWIILNLYQRNSLFFVRVLYRVYKSIYSYMWC